MQDLRKRTWWADWGKSLAKYWQLYLLLIPVIVYYLLFK